MLKGTLESIAKQNLPQQCFETIVVDNGSTDKTKKAAKSFIDKIPNLRYFYEETPGLHVGRHKGLKEAKADIFVYADDDIEAFPTWLEGIAEAFEDKDVVLVGGKNLPKFETEPPDWILQMWEKDQAGNRIMEYLSILDLGDKIKTINPYHVFGCNFSIRKPVLLEAGGFHPDAMPKEVIKYRGDGESYVSKYVLVNGHKTLYHPKASVYHLVSKKRMTESYFCKRAYNQGISNSYIQIRAAHGLAYRAKSPYERLKQMSQSDIVRAIGRRAKRVISRSRKEPFDEIQGKIAQAYRAGWQFHQNEVQNDPELLEYVLKHTYLE